MQTFEALKDAWLNRKREIEARGKALGGAGLFGAGGYGYGGAYGGQQAQELARLEHVSPPAHPAPSSFPQNLPPSTSSSILMFLVCGIDPDYLYDIQLAKEAEQNAGASTSLDRS